MCQLAQVSRAGFYRLLQAHQPMEEDMDVRSAIQGIAVAHRRRYGYRRITAELRRRGPLGKEDHVAGRFLKLSLAYFSGFGSCRQTTFISLLSFLLFPTVQPFY